MYLKKKLAVLLALLYRKNELDVIVAYIAQRSKVA